MAVYVLSTFVLAYFISATKAGYISVTTPIQSVVQADFSFTLLTDFGYELDITKPIIIEVKACQDAYIGLMENEIKTTALFNIAIGGYTNSRTVLYRNKMQTYLVGHTGQLLSCDSFKTFNVRLANGKIQLWAKSGISWTEILSYDTVENTRIKLLGVTTSKWGNGEWRVFIDDPTTTSEMTTTLMDGHVSTTIETKPTAISNSMDACADTTMTKVTWSQDSDKQDLTYTSPSYRITGHVSRIDCLQQCQMYCDCRYVTINTTLCQGFSGLNSSPIISNGTSLWTRL